VVATLLAYLDDPSAVEERPPLDSLLAPLNRDQLQALVLSLAEGDPALAARVEVQAAALQAAPKPGKGGKRARLRPPAFDAADVRRQVRAAVRSLGRMRSSDAYWHAGGAERQVVKIAEQARPFFEAGDVPSALTLLEAVTEEYLKVWPELDGSDGESGEVFNDLGELWAEALLSGELSTAERERWEDRLADWQAELEDYGVDDAFYTAETALREGWDGPDVVRALRGDVAPRAEPPSPETSSFLAGTRDLTDIRLAILERQGRTDEYLHLAQATGRRTAYAKMLLELGRAAEAVEYGLASLTTPADALALAQALHAQGATAEALRVGAHGLTLQTPRFDYGGPLTDDELAEREEGSYTDAEIDVAQHYGIAPGADYQRATLARWLRDVAHAAGDDALALRAAVQVVRDDPSLADYLGVQALAGDAWPSLREELLAHLRGLHTYNVQPKADIFLHEGLVDDAIAVADAAAGARDLAEQVADAALTSHPDWVIRRARARASNIIEGGDSPSYEEAVRWLARWRDAAREADREREWRAYLDEIMERHRRKYKLMPLLRDLDE
jgi:uncharacterized Zn finger protein